MAGCWCSCFGLLCTRQLFFDLSLISESDTSCAGSKQTSSIQSSSGQAEVVFCFLSSPQDLRLRLKILGMLLGFLEILSMCVLQETVALRLTPRYFVASSVIMMCPISLWEGGLKGVWILIHSGHCISEDGIPCPTWISTLSKHQGLAVGRHNHGPYIMQSSANKHVWRMS